MPLHSADETSRIVMAQVTQVVTVLPSNGRLRQECLNEHWFLGMQDAQDNIKACRTHYNDARPRSSLNWMSLNESPRSSPVKRAASGT